MMDKTYIVENGVLEQYVLGELMASEQEQVHQALHLYPELRERLIEIEYSFEHLAIDNGIDVPESVKKELFNALVKRKIKTLPAETVIAKRSMLWVAASIAVSMSLGAMYLFSELNALNEEFQIVSEENKNLNTTIEELNTSLDETNNWYQTINNPETDRYVLKGNSLMPEATIISYVNNVKKSVVINTRDLPELDDEHDYQMWADVEGVMIDMGIIDKRKEMLAMTYIANAESLNITIEEKGGSDHPNVSKLVTNIYLD